MSLLIHIKSVKVKVQQAVVKDFSISGCARILVYLFSFGFCLQLSGQPRNITLIIDTLYLIDLKEFKPATTRVYADTELNRNWILYDTIPVERIQCNLNSYPNYITRVQIPNDSTELLLPFDDGGGYLSILNSFKAKSDTIRIASWKIFSNCFKDSIINSINYWKVKYKGDLSESPGKKSKHKIRVKTIKKPCKYPPPPQVLFVEINNKKYAVKMDTPQQLDIHLEIACGYKNYHPDWAKKPPTRMVYRQSRLKRCIRTINVLHLSLQ